MELWEQVREVLSTSGDSFRLVELVECDGTPAEVAARYEGLVLDLYWKAKDLAGSMAAARLGIHHCLARALSGAPEEGRPLRLAASRMAYNLGSFTLTLWDESGIAIGPAEQAAGLDAAHLALRLARELELEPRALANAHWLLGAAYLCLGRSGEAAGEFEASVPLARQTADPDFALLCEGYLALVREKLAAAPPGTLAAVLKRLRELDTDDARFALEQLLTAQRVLG